MSITKLYRRRLDTFDNAAAACARGKGSHAHKSSMRSGRTDREPDLSIVAIIPLYNGARWIERSIQSVLAQTLQPDEFIVVDDGSTDNGAAIVEKLAKQHPAIQLLRKENGGQSSARNFGVAHSRSALIAFLDQDDDWYPHHLEMLVRPFRRQCGVTPGWVYSNLDEIDESGGVVRRNCLDPLPLEHPKRSLKKCLSHDLFILPSASLISRKAFEAVGCFDERLCGHEDDDLFLRMFRAGYGNVYINESLSKWRIYLASTSFTSRFATSRMIYADKLFDQFPDDQKRHRYWSRDCIAPRFIVSILGDIARAVDHADRRRFLAAIKDLKVLVPRLSRPRRLIIRMLLLCANFNLALFINRLGIQDLVKVFLDLKRGRMTQL